MGGDNNPTIHRRDVVVLVVEDEPLQRLDMLEMIEDAGFIALEARDADEAITILETRADVRVVFTDIDMPGSIDGLRLAAAIRDRWPPIEIIVTTSGFRPDIEKLPKRAVFVPKPLVARDAVRAIRSLVEARYS